MSMENGLKSAQGAVHIKAERVERFGEIFVGSVEAESCLSQHTPAMRQILTQAGILEDLQHGVAEISGILGDQQPVAGGQVQARRGQGRRHGGYPHGEQLHQATARAAAEAQRQYRQGGGLQDGARIIDGPEKLNIRVRLHEVAQFRRSMWGDHRQANRTETTAHARQHIITQMI